jgi:hypothetical protein
MAPPGAAQHRLSGTPITILGSLIGQRILRTPPHQAAGQPRRPGYRSTAETATTTHQVQDSLLPLEYTARRPLHAPRVLLIRRQLSRCCRTISPHHVEASTRRLRFISHASVALVLHRPESSHSHQQECRTVELTPSRTSVTGTETRAALPDTRFARGSCVRPRFAPGLSAGPARWGARRAGPYRRLRAWLCTSPHPRREPTRPCRRRDSDTRKPRS